MMRVQRGANPEQESNRRALSDLKSVAWAEPLLKEIDRRGGLAAPRSFFFELRYASEIHSAGFTATYEFKTGVANSSVDFCIHSTPEWLVELFSPWPHASNDEESQMRKLAGTLSDKVWSSSGIPSKFPAPSSRVHMVLLDARNYLYGMGDFRDWRQIVYGPAGVRKEDDWAVHYLNDEPIRGPFDPVSPIPSAQTFRERVHFVGFMNERTYTPQEMRTSKAAYYLANPFLFSDQDAMAAAFKSYALKPSPG